MFEQVNETVRYAKAATGIGIVTHGDKALLIDSGLDENLVRKIINALDREGVEVAAIANTHSHADHCGGNAFAVKRTGCRVCAPAFEHVFIERPMLEPWSLFGAPPPDSLSGKFLQATPSRVDDVVHAEGVRNVAGFEVRFHELGGHSVRQMGAEVDGVLFVGDALLPEAILSKYGLAFAVDPLKARESSRKLLDVAPEHVVCYHGGLVGDVPALVKTNVEAVDAVERMLLETLAREPATAEVLFDVACDAFGRPTTVELHTLNLAAVRGYLASLERAGRLKTSLSREGILWHAV